MKATNSEVMISPCSAWKQLEGKRGQRGNFAINKKSFQNPWGGGRGQGRGDFEIGNPLTCWKCSRATEGLKMGSLSTKFEALPHAIGALIVASRWFFVFQMVHTTSLPLQHNTSPCWYCYPAAATVLLDLLIFRIGWHCVSF